ncbi:protein Wnt-10a-like X3, partial [Biomphalaria glabrata]
SISRCVPNTLTLERLRDTAWIPRGQYLRERLHPFNRSVVLLLTPLTPLGESM